MNDIDERRDVEQPTPAEMRTHRLRKAAVALVTAIQSRAGVDDAWTTLQEAMGSSLAGGNVPIVEENLFDLWDAADDLPQPTLAARADGRCLLYPSKIHWLSGEPGSGKTWLALLWTIEQVRAGSPVLYIDMESDPVTITARLRTMGITRDELRLVRYLSVRWDMPSLASTVQAIVDKMSGTTPSLVILDGLATALAQLGLDENSNSDISRFTSSVLRPLTEAGPALVVVDHMAKPQAGDKSQTRYARGGGAKLADASGVAYLLTVAVPFSKTKPGLAKLIVGKDRNGAVGAAGETVAEVAFTPGDDELLVEVNVPEDAGDRWIPNGLMSKLSAVLATSGTMTAGEASSALGTKSWQKHGTKVTALLEKYNYISVERKGTSKVFTHLALFTDSDAERVRSGEYGALPGAPTPTSDPF